MGFHDTRIPEFLQNPLNELEWQAIGLRKLRAGNHEENTIQRRIRQCPNRQVIEILRMSPEFRPLFYRH